MPSQRWMLLLVSLAPLTAEGCALHVNGRTQPVMIVTDPPGAEVLYDSRLFQTPVLINMKRAGTVDVPVHKSGYATTTAIFQGESEDGLLVLSFLLYGGPIGVAVDLISGAHWWMAPDTRRITLREIPKDQVGKADHEWLLRKRIAEFNRDPWRRRIDSRSRR